MRGYDALMLVDISRQGGEPGTLYVMEALEEEVDAGIEDGQVINPHGMDPQTVLRFVKTLGAWPGKVVVVACEPAQVEEMGSGLSDEVARAVDGAVELVVETIEELAGGRRLRGRLTPCTSCRSPARSSTPSIKHAAGRRGERREHAHRRAAPGRAGHARVLLRLRLGGNGLRGRAAGAGAGSGAAALRGVRARVGDRGAGVHVPRLRGRRTASRWRSGNEFEVESIEVEEAECIAQR